jgi:hypothetical protein
MIIEEFSARHAGRSVRYGLAVSQPHFGSAWPAGISSSYRLMSGTWNADRVARKAGAAARLSSHNVAAADPNSLTILPCPASRSPDVIRAAHIIARAASIVWPIANRDRDGAWVGCVPWTVTGSVWATAVIRPSIIPPSTAVVRAIAVVATAVVRATAVIPTAVIRIGASACANHDNNEQEPENRPRSSHYGFGVTGSCLRFPMSNSIGFHTFIIRIRPNFCAFSTVLTMSRSNCLGCRWRRLHWAQRSFFSKKKTLEKVDSYTTP